MRETRLTLLLIALGMQFPSTGRKERVRKGLIPAILIALMSGTALAEGPADSAEDPAGAAAGQAKHRYFLGIGEPGPEAWRIMIEDPIDREVAMGKALEALGGKMISYFWGLADGKNYTTAKFPDDPGMIQAMYLGRLSQGVLKSYTFIELMTSADMTEALKRVPEFTAPVK